MTKNLKDKLKNLETTINNTKSAQKPQCTSPPISGLKYISLITVEILAGISVGSFIGYYFDKFFSTKPLFFIVFMILGLAGGFINILRNLK